MQIFVEFYKDSLHFFYYISYMDIFQHKKALYRAVKSLSSSTVQGSILQVKGKLVEEEREWLEP
jgi:hypothetical protein